MCVCVHWMCGWKGHWGPVTNTALFTVLSLCLSFSPSLSDELLARYFLTCVMHTVALLQYRDLHTHTHTGALCTHICKHAHLQIARKLDARTPHTHRPGPAPCYPCIAGLPGPDDSCVLSESPSPSDHITLWVDELEHDTASAA